MANEGATAVIQDDQTAEAPDDGFTPEERAQFEAMKAETPAPTSSAEPAPASPEPATATPAAAAPAATADDDDDEPAPAAAAAPGTPQAVAEQQHPRRVSWSKYSRETEELRKKVAEAEGTIAEQRTNQARLDERLRIINEALTTPPPQQTAAEAQDDPKPDPEQDVFGYVKWLERQVERTNQQFQEFASTQTERQQAESENINLNNSYLQDANTFAAREPNFVPAYQFLMQSRVNELAHYFFGKDLTEQGTKLTPQETKQITDEITSEERALVQNAMKGNRSPAQEVYKMARMRGFRPEAPAAAAPAQNGNGAAQPAGAAPAAARPNGNGAAAPAAQPSVSAEIARIRSGQDAALSLSQGGGAPAVTLDAQRLASMPDDEFNALLDSMSESQRRAIMGG